MMEQRFPTSGAWDEADLAALAAAPLAEPFASVRTGFIAAVSEAMLTDPAMRAYPELMALAFWFRAAHLSALQIRAPHSVTACGTVLHIAPANVDTVFVYSWFLSLLMGNRNIVRLSTRTRPVQMEVLLNTLRTVAARPEYQEVAAANRVITYDHDDALTGRISAACAVRAVWGGDAAVAHISAIAMPPNARQITFPDRFSLAVWNASAVAKAEPVAFERLLQAMFNDVFWFDQRACSSPRALVWVGNEVAIRQAQARFWPAFTDYLAARGYADQPAASLMRTTALMRLAVQEGSLMPGFRVTGAAAHFPLRVPVPGLTERHRAVHCGTGWLYELQRPTLADVPPLLSQKDQTIAAYGFDDTALAAFRAALAHSHQRLVETGTALSFDAVWDGVNLLQAFSRSTSASA